MTGEQVRGAVKDGRGYNQIEWIKLLLLQSEYSFCSLSSTNGGLRDSDSSLEKDQLDQVVAYSTNAADRLRCAVHLTSIVTVHCRIRTTDQLRGPNCKRSSAVAEGVWCRLFVSVLGQGQPSSPSV